MEKNSQLVKYIKIDVCLFSSSLLIEGSVEPTILDIVFIRQLVTRTALDLTRTRTSDVGSILPVWDGRMSLCQGKIQRSIGKVTEESIVDNEYFQYVERKSYINGSRCTLAM